MQFFVGLSGFTTEPIFDPSLFVDIRKRIGANTFDQLNVELIKSATAESDDKHNHSPNKKDSKGEPKNKGKLQADATVADQYIKYPTDTDLLNSGRKLLEKMIDMLYARNDKLGLKPRTYRRNMDKSFLGFSKKRRKTKSEIRKMRRKLLEQTNRDIRPVNKMLDVFEQEGKCFPLDKETYRKLLIITTLYQQQKQMHETKTSTCSNRIVSIHQPHVRPIKRGKQNSNTEFGSKLGVSLDQGFARIDTLSWDAYNESSDLKKQVGAYRKLHGYYPELVQVDQIYPTKENRKWLTDRGIRITAPPLGRKPSKLKMSNYQKRKHKKEATERNHIEAKFGQGKNGYNLNKIRARLKETSESWVGCIFFIMNLIKFDKEFFLSVFEWLLFTLFRNQDPHKNKIINSLIYPINNNGYICEIAS